MDNAQAREVELKTDSAVFVDVVEGRKLFEIRLNDRDFKIGDDLVLRETLYTGSEMKAGAPLIYSDRTVRRRVGYIMAGPVYGLAEGWAILGFDLAALPAQDAEPVRDERAAFMQAFPNAIWFDVASQPSQEWAIDKWQGWQARAALSQADVRDAMRYRWLQAEANLDYVEFQDQWFESASDLDTAIDAAIKAQEGKS